MAITFGKAEKEEMTIPEANKKRTNILTNFQRPSRHTFRVSENPSHKASLQSLTSSPWVSSQCSQATLGSGQETTESHSQQHRQAGDDWLHQGKGTNATHFPKPFLYKAKALSYCEGRRGSKLVHPQGHHVRGRNKTRMVLREGRKTS